MLSGRLPNHITTVQPDGANLCSDFLPLAATLLSEKLTGGGYVSHFVGKGHLGYETMDHLPVNRGFKSHVGYLEGSQSYYWGCGSAGGEHATAPCKRQRLSIRWAALPRARPLAHGLSRWAASSPPMWRCPVL